MSSVRARMLAAGLLAPIGSCGAQDLPPEGHFVLHVTTDAPVPFAFGQPVPEDHVALFDRLMFEVFPSGESEPCAECVREFPIDTTMVDAGRASIGIVPQAGSSGARVRVRLFRGDIDAPSPRSESSLETVVLLPPAPASGVEHLTVTLHTENVGVTTGTLEAPSVPQRGLPGSGLVGTWTESKRRVCSGAAASNEVCVPGGPFWMGDPRIDFAGAYEYQGGKERLVVLSPFFLDRTEVTVGAFRVSGLAETTEDGAIFNPQPASSASYCSYLDEPSDGDMLPVNCLTWRLAQAYCLQQGKRLPTEAELAYASSSLGASTYVWGEELPACGDAVHERGSSDAACSEWGLGPSTVGGAVRDRLDLAGGAAFDLAGNVMEFAADFWQLDREPCWSGGGVLRDPSCDRPSTEDRIGRSLHGGAFSDPPLFLRAALRTSIEGESKAVSEIVGFRCARSDD